MAPVWAGVDDLAVSEGVESWLVAWDFFDEGVANSEGEIWVFDIDVVYHCVGTGHLVANPTEDVVRVCCETGYFKFCPSRD
jgi:hypothetical protein